MQVTPPGMFDPSLISCHAGNVLIYFNQGSKVVVLDRLARQIEPDG
jgi:chemotaxis methyl-accepting protein methylase